ncbi:putative Alkaline phosphatase, tissue-nonspecific isozyme, partial [Operophtera brumata]
VILGGGMQMMVSDSPGTPSDPLDTWSCRRQDGMNLINSYIQDKQSRNLKYSYVRNNQELRNLNVADTDYLFGIFANGHLKYEFERDDGPQGMPSIVDMTEAAIKVLQKNNNGFFLMVEGGNVDMAHHRGRAKTAINESSAFDDAIQRALAMTDEQDTLIIVTADHTHTLSINGYQDRGADLFASRWDSTNYTTLSYGTGGPDSMHYYAETNAAGQVEVKRRDPSLEDTNDFYYEQVAGIRSDENTHGGGDVTVYAKGPYSHLFHNIHEQHYVYHAISFAAKLGEYGRPRFNWVSNAHRHHKTGD